MRQATQTVSSSAKRRGFTIVELLIVIVVIGILAAITIVAYNGITGRARAVATQSAVRQAADKIMADAVTSGSLPATLAAVGVSDSGGTAYQYTLNSAASPNNYCITATNGGVSYQIAGTIGEVYRPVEGPCPGHTGAAPTVAVSGPCPTGYIVVPGSSLYSTDAFCVMKYEAKNPGSGPPVSTASGTPWVNINELQAVVKSTEVCGTCHLITEAEWLTIAQNVMSVGSNWSGGSVGSGSMYRGHSDAAPNNSLAASTDSDGYAGTGQSSGEQRRTLTLTNGQVIWDFAGNVNEWTAGTTAGGNQPGAVGYAWRDWNALTMQGSISPNPYPSYANLAAGGWNSSQNIGQVYSDSSETGARGFFRGDGWGSFSNAGVFSLDLSYSPSSQAIFIGFRVAR